MENLVSELSCNTRHVIMYVTAMYLSSFGQFHPGERSSAELSVQAELENKDFSHRAETLNRYVCGGKKGER